MRCKRMPRLILMLCEVSQLQLVITCIRQKLIFLAMSSSQTRIAETISLFYTADRASDVSYIIPTLIAELSS